MSTEALELLRNKMLTLPEQERAELAHDLLQSLDTPADDGAEQAWNSEILRRIEQIDAGQIKLMDRVEFSRRMREGIGAG